MLRNKLYYSLPYGARRKLFSIIKPEKFKEMQYNRTVDTNDSYSFKPFDQHQCIFVHIPKSAGVSICRALFGNLAAGHETMSTYQRVFSKNEFDRYFKFTFIRNPWDRLFSAYNFLKKGGMYEWDRTWADENIAPYENFHDFVMNGISKPSIQQWVHFRTQSNFLYVPGDRKLHIDFLGFYENIQDDFQYVANRLGLGDRAVLRHENAGKIGDKLDYRDFYTKKTRNIVSVVYKSDIENFGYNFDNSSLEAQLKNRL